MRLCNGDLIRNIRKDMKLTQEAMAEELGISARQLSRIENGESDIELWQFMSIMEQIGQPVEDYWLLYLGTKEYEEYRTFRFLKRLTSDRKYTEAMEVLRRFEAGLLSKQPFIMQFVAIAKVKADKDISDKDAITAMLEVIRMTKPKFDESKVAEYRLTSNEIAALIELASRYFSTGCEEKAISLAESIIESRHNIHASEEDRASLLPALMSNLSTMLGRVGRYEESLRYCNMAKDISTMYSDYRLLPLLLFNSASCQYHLGEEKHVYRTELIRAFHCANAMGQYETAKTIKENAKLSLGVTIKST